MSSRENEREGGGGALVIQRTSFLNATSEVSPRKLSVCP